MRKEFALPAPLAFLCPSCPGRDVAGPTLEPMASRDGLSRSVLVAAVVVLMGVVVWQRGATTSTGAGVAAPSSGRRLRTRRGSSCCAPSDSRQPVDLRCRHPRNRHPRARSRRRCLRGARPQSPGARHDLSANPRGRPGRDHQYPAPGCRTSWRGTSGRSAVSARKSRPRPARARSRGRRRCRRPRQDRNRRSGGRRGRPARRRPPQRLLPWPATSLIWHPGRELGQGGGDRQLLGPPGETSRNPRGRAAGGDRRAR